MVHKRRPMASEGRLALKEKVFRWLREGLIRKDMYPFPEEGEGLASLMRSILFHPYAESIKKLSSYTLEDDGEGLNLSKRTESISTFTPKLEELKYPIPEARMRLETTKGLGWTNEAEEAL
ncbi:hypothetical protein Tco_0123319 [Tanacetum coccineum]